MKSHSSIIGLTINAQLRSNLVPGVYMILGVIM